MKNLFTWLVMAAAAWLTGCSEQKPVCSSYEEYPVPEGEIQELQYSPEASTFQVWAPMADKVKVHIYAEGVGGDALQSVEMKRQKAGLWSVKVKEDLMGKFYTFNIEQDGIKYAETPGIFAKAVGINGRRAAIIQMDKTNPEGWAEDQKPALNDVADAVIYEMHWRDFSAHATAPVQNKGKFLSLTEPEGIKHLVDLGVTHIHILPSYDYASVKEDQPDVPQYNWGYDPLNYNVPEGSYSTNAADPYCRIREFKQMVQACHKAGIRVVLDVVYNHTFDIDGSNFHLTAPGYFHRQRPDGSYGNGSGCGNETASERPMMRKFMLQSIRYWMEEYHLDGFRFDLMGIHDIETMNQISALAHGIDPQVLIYGEGWAAEAPQYPDSLLAMKAHTHELNGIAAFSDELRDALRGPFWSDEQGAFLVGLEGHEQNIRFGIAGAVEGWAKEPSQMISYVSCHDDMCLVDRLRATKKGIKQPELIALHKLAQTAVLTSQGIPFIFCGEEVLRDKKGVHNSYNSPDSINAIDWTLKQQNIETYQYYADLIAMRKAHKAFHMGKAELVKANLSFIETQSGVVAYQINGAAVGDPWESIIVVMNANTKPAQVAVPNGKYTIVLANGKVNANGISTTTGSMVTVAPQSAMIMHTGK